MRKSEIYKRTVRLFLPVALQNLLTLSLGISDNLFAARIGKDAISAIVVGGQMQLMLQFIVYGISGTALLAVSRMRGRCEREKILGVVMAAAAASLAVGGAFCLLCRLTPLTVTSFFTVRSDIAREAADYLRLLSLSFPLFALSGSLTAVLRAIGRAKLALYSSVVALLVNAGVNYLGICTHIIGEPRTSVIGLTSILSRLAELLVLLLSCLAIARKVGVKLRAPLSELPGALLTLWQYGKYIILGQLTWAINSLFATLVIGTRLPREAVAALGVATLMHNLSYVMINALSVSVCAVLASLAEGTDTEEQRAYIRRAEAAHLLLGAASGVLIFLFSTTFISFYNLSEAAGSIARSFLSVLSFTVIGTAYQSGALYGILRAEGRTRFVFLCDLVFVLLLVIPYSFAAVESSLAPFTVYAALRCDQVLKCIPAAIRLHRPAEEVLPVPR